MRQRYEEADRLAFVIQRDGLPGALTFARQTYRQYREARKTGYGKENRRSLVEACLVMRQFIRVNR